MSKEETIEEVIDSTRAYLASLTEQMALLFPDLSDNLQAPDLFKTLKNEIERIEERLAGLEGELQDGPPT